MQYIWGRWTACEIQAKEQRRREITWEMLAKMIESYFLGLFLRRCQDVGYIASNERMTDKDELERTRKEMMVIQSRYYPRIYLQGLGKTTKNLNKDNSVPVNNGNQYISNTSLER
jgi:hypothetical protein